VVASSNRRNLRTGVDISDRSELFPPTVWHPSTAPSEIEITFSSIFYTIAIEALKPSGSRHHLTPRSVPRALGITTHCSHSPYIGTSWCCFMKWPLLFWAPYHYESLAPHMMINTTGLMQKVRTETRSSVSSLHSLCFYKVLPYVYLSPKVECISSKSSVITFAQHI